MDTFKDLLIHADDKQMEEIMEVVTQKMAGSLWSRNANKNNNILNVEKIYSFQRKKDKALPGAGLSIFPRHNDEGWYVPNVVPLEFGQLTQKQYNDILTEFYVSYIDTVSRQHQIRCELTSGQVDDADVLGEEAAILLRRFSNCANKSTGSSHPVDKERWIAFIYASCMSEKEVDSGLLQKLLIEQGWGEESAYELIIEYEFGRDVIKYVKDHA